MLYDKVILFDGACTFCHRSVQFILKHDKKAAFSFTSLDSQIGKHLRKHYQIPSSMDSVLLIQNDRYYSKSTAVLHVCRHLNGLYPLLIMLLVIPKSIRNSVYDWIAKNRKRFTRRDAVCSLPSPDEQKRFLH